MNSEFIVSVVVGVSVYALKILKGTFSYFRPPNLRILSQNFTCPHNIYTMKYIEAVREIAAHQPHFTIYTFTFTPHACDHSSAFGGVCIQDSIPCEISVAFLSRHKAYERVYRFLPFTHTHSHRDC